MKDLTKNMRICLLASFLFLFGCASYLAEQKKLKLQREEAKLLGKELKIESTCKYYGFKENTVGFTDCLMNLDLARKTSYYN